MVTLIRRVSAVVRTTAANLGCTIHDRLRVNATAALKGDSARAAVLLYIVLSQTA
jgi:hypothetical protein